MKKVLVVEDSAVVMKILRHVLSQSKLLEPVYATSFAEAKEALAGHADFFAGIIDLSLPDAPNGEVVDHTLSLNIPTLVLTGSFDEAKRESLLAKGIVDYVTKEGRFSYEYAMGVVHRLIKNQNNKIMVVDAVDEQRNFLVKLLKNHRYQVLSAKDGVEAIKLLLDNLDTKVLITDYDMPRMNGFDLVRNIRVKHEKTDLTIIGVSSFDDPNLSAKFIKNGANDFLKRPFNHEEFYCRLNNNIELIELVESIRQSSYKDDLTGIYNRKYFFEKGQTLYAQAEEKSGVISAALIELDGFGSIVDAYGHEVGDLVLKYISSQMAKAFERFVFARSGGHEFLLLMSGLSNEKATAFVGQVRQIISSKVIPLADASISVTYSAGVTSIIGEGLEAMINEASVCLARAKEAGGDLVFGDD